MANTSSDYRKKEKNTHLCFNFVLLGLISDLQIVKLTLERAKELDRISSKSPCFGVTRTPLIRRLYAWNKTWLCFRSSFSAWFKMFSIFGYRYAVCLCSGYDKGQNCCRIVVQGAWVSWHFFEYMVNEAPSTRVVFTLLVGKQIDRGDVCEAALQSWARLEFHTASRAVSPQRCWK